MSPKEEEDVGMDKEMNPWQDFLDEVEAEHLKRFIRQARQKGLFVWCSPHKERFGRHTGGWIVTFQAAISRAAEELNGEALRVLNFFMGTTDFGNVIMIRMDKIGERLRMRKQNVSRAIKVLTEKGYILKERRGRNNIYMLNPAVVWKGQAKEWKKAHAKVIPIRPSVDDDMPF